MNNLSIKNFSLQETYNNDKTKWKDYDFVRVINCTYKLTHVCACTCACNCMHLREQCAINTLNMSTNTFSNIFFSENVLALFLAMLLMHNKKKNILGLCPNPLHSTPTPTADFQHNFWMTQRASAIACNYQPNE